MKKRYGNENLAMMRILKQFILTYDLPVCASLYVKVKILTYKLMILNFTS